MARAAKQVGAPSITALWHTNRHTHSHTKDLNSWLMGWNGTELIPPRSCFFWSTEMPWSPPAAASSTAYLTQTRAQSTHPPSSLSLFRQFIHMGILRNPGDKTVTSPQQSLEHGKQERSTSVNFSLVFIAETRRGAACSSLYKRYRISTASSMERWNAHICSD